MVKYTYQIIVALHVEDLLEQLIRLGQDGWSIAAYIQEHAFIKLVLQKEI